MDLKQPSNGIANKQINEESKIYCDSIKIFLQNFKSQPCMKVNCIHNEMTCMGTHNNLQIRRNPYTTHTFAYFPKKQRKLDILQIQSHLFSQNQMEQIYHPLNYKLQQCLNYYGCKLGLFCPYFHPQDKIHFEYGEFFRFDILTFKSKLCKRRQNHQRKICINYHSDADRRRQCKNNEYSHVLCSNLQKCDDKCSYSHNKIEQLYHPSRYKSKFCSSYTNKNTICKYRDFCSFAHTQSQITIRMIHLETHEPDFYIYLFKTVWCPFITNHDKGKCQYAHNLQDYRRNPLEYKYKAQQCPNWLFDSDEIMSLQQAGCKNGMKCDKCHGWMEKKFHPHVYKKNTNRIKRQQDFISKKVNINDNNIKGSYLKGAPFFKNTEIEVSQGSRRTNSKTINISSDRSNQGSDNKDQHKSQKIVQNHTLYITSCEEQTAIWHYLGDLNNPNKQLQRAKSLGKPQDADVSYSTSIKDMFQQTNILPKLRGKRINEVKIINLKDQQISEFKFLTIKEREILSQKIKEYARKRDPCSIQYSSALTKFFVKRKCEQILQKMKNKKVKESKLLNLMSREIEELSFLLPFEKNTLPQILKQFSNNQQFEDILKLINENTQNTQPT